MKAVIKTNRGEININLFADRTPITVASFVNLVQRGYYNGLIFHRVINNFMIQGGCPEGTGYGGPGYRFEDEFHDDLGHDAAGKLSMANAGKGTNGSQFFITHGPTPHLDGNHTVFGAVVGPADQAVVNQIQKGDSIQSIQIDDDTSALMEQMADRVTEWDKTLDQKYPRK